MNIVDPSTRDAFREEQIRAIKVEIRQEYATLIRAAKAKPEKKALKAERNARIASQTEALILERRPLPPPGHCRKCSYNLTANESGVCPECGTEVEMA